MERSPRFASLVGGMLDFVEDCGIDLSLMMSYNDATQAIKVVWDGEVFEHKIFFN